MEDEQTTHLLNNLEGFDSFGNDEFKRIMVDLDGTTILPKPRVSRDTMVSILREHTRLLKDSQKQLKAMTGALRVVTKDTAETKRQMREMKSDVEKHTEQISDLFNSTVTMQQDIIEMKEQISDILLLKKDVKDNEEKLAGLRDDFNERTRKIDSYIKITADNLKNLEDKNSSTNVQLAALQDYVDHFGDNLVLASSQIVVEAEVGITKKPTPLREVLKIFKGNFSEVEASLGTQSKLLSEHTEDISKKADESILFDVQSLQGRVKTIETRLKREEEQGVNELRRNVENLTETCELVQYQVGDKMGKEEVDILVHKKYEDIVNFLQDALRSGAEDEQEFNRKTQELNAMIMKLDANKVDRLEIVPIQETLIKAETSLSKLDFQGRSGDGNSEAYSKAEIDALLDLKMDKFEVGDDSELSAYRRLKKNQKRNTTTSIPACAADNDNEMWKGLAVSLHDESQLVMQRAAASVMALRSPPKARTPAERVPQNSPGMFRYASEAGIPGGEHGIDYSISHSAIHRKLPIEKNSIRISNARAKLKEHEQRQFITVSAREGSPSDIHGNDVTFLGGPFLGGGYNLGQAQLSKQNKQQLHPLGGNSSGEQPVIEEDANMLIKGRDGRFYYTDRDSVSPSTNDDGVVKKPRIRPTKQPKTRNHECHRCPTSRPVHA